MATLDRVVIGRGALQRLPAEWARAGLPARAFLIADATVMEIHGERALGHLRAGGVETRQRTFPAGESSKSVETATSLWNWLIESGAERSDPIVALGGGVAGDLVGFVAATYARGAPLVQIPTTLLAQVDSSVGGKVAVDLPGAKNLVGAFWPARLTLIDPDLLSSLPQAQLVADCAEVIKTAMIFDAAMFDLIEAQAERLDDPDFRAQLIDRCVRWKARVVDQDPHERGARAILNYGHTIAHGLEAAAGYGRYRHGEAVAIGMVGAAEIAVRSGRLDRRDADRQNRLLARLGLPRVYEHAEPAAILERMRRDKKVRDGSIKWVLPDRVGAASIGVEVDIATVVDVLSELRSDAR